MTDFRTELRHRYRTAQAALHAARETGDEYGADVRDGELDSIRKLANDHGIELEDNPPDPA